MDSIKVARLLLFLSLGVSQSFPQVSRIPAAPQTTDLANSSPEISDLVRQKKWKEVIQVSSTLRTQRPRDAMPAYWSGIAHLQLHEPVAATQSLRIAEKLGLDSAVFHEDLGLAYYALNQFVLFEEQMKKASERDSNDSRPYFYLGLYRWTVRSDAEGALELYKKSSRLQPGDWKSIYQEGNCLEQLGRIVDAKERYERSISLIEETSQPFGWPYQGMARLAMDEDAPAALEYARKAVVLEPDEYSHHLVLSQVYERVGNEAEAIREGEIATKQNPSDAKSRYALYKLYRKSGDPRAAAELRMFEQIKSLYGAD